MTRCWLGTCHQGFKKHSRSVYKYFEKVSDLIPIFRTIISDLIFHIKILKVGAALYTEFVQLMPFLYQYLENRYPSHWHVPVPELYLVHPQGFTAGLPANYVKEKHFSRFGKLMALAPPPPLERLNFRHCFRYKICKSKTKIYRVSHYLTQDLEFPTLFVYPKCKCLDCHGLCNRSSVLFKASYCRLLTYFQ